MNNRKFEKTKNNQIKIFGTKDGINIVKSPIKSKILSILEKNDKSGAEIVKLTGKSKATISAHMNDLVKTGIVNSKPNPTDGRSKLFYIKSKSLGNLSPENKFKKEMDTYITENIVNSSDPFKFFRFIFRTIRVTLMEAGFNIDPILHKAGFKVGLAYYDKLKNENIEIMMDNIVHFWKENKLGNITVENLKPLTIKAYNCFECEDLPKIGKSACAFDSGILEALFSMHFSENIVVKEIKCFAKGDDHCCFRVDKNLK
ncbi:MAG: ArsR family transcriptional regulator [Methanobacterium sp.]|nr:ArsR family transcriptional regulator [Methanobacterium sp.]